MAETPPHLPRHEMVWVSPDTWSAVLDEHGMRDPDSPVSDWAAKGWPLVVRTHGCGDPPHLLALGLPLPPGLGKQRLAFRFDAHVVDRSDKPPLLAEAATVAPASWRYSLSLLLPMDAHTRCYGSLAWEFLTGLSYLTTDSDLDLLWYVGSQREADHLARGIARIDVRAPMRIDGEFIIPDGSGIQWREWHLGDEAVLVKTPDGPKLLSRDRIFA